MNKKSKSGNANSNNEPANNSFDKPASDNAGSEKAKLNKLTNQVKDRQVKDRQVNPVKSVGQHKQHQHRENRPLKPISNKSIKQNPQIVLPIYPNAEILPGEPGPTNIEITEMITPDEWGQVLDHYREAMVAEGWQLFAEHKFADRSTLSFRRDTSTVTILAIELEDGTQIRIYIQAK